MESGFSHGRGSGTPRFPVRTTKRWPRAPVSNSSRCRRSVSTGLGRKWGISLAPNMQLFLLITSLAVLFVRDWPAITSSTQLGVLMVAAAVGVGLGGRLAGHVSPSRAGLLTTGIAALSALVAIGRGVAGMV